MLGLVEGAGRRPPVIRAVATEGTGIAELLDAVEPADRAGPANLTQESAS